jgi:hypothetical protein
VKSTTRSPGTPARCGPQLGSRAPSPSRTPHGSWIRGHLVPGAPIGRRRGTRRRPRRLGMQMGTTRRCCWDPWRADCRRVGLAVLARLNQRSGRTQREISCEEMRPGEEIREFPCVGCVRSWNPYPCGQPYFFREFVQPYCVVCTLKLTLQILYDNIIFTILFKFLDVYISAA